MKIKATDKLIDGATGLVVVYTGGLTRQDYTDRDEIENLRANGKDWYIYQEPVGFDPLIHKLGDMIYTAPYCTNDKLPLTPEEQAEQATIKDNNDRANFKYSRQQLVDQIKVTTIAGNTFDGDETSQTRMARAIVGMEAAETIIWVLADNSVIQATVEELKEALNLAGRAQEAIWLP